MTDTVAQSTSWSVIPKVIGGRSMRDIDPTERSASDRDRLSLPSATGQVMSPPHLPAGGGSRIIW